MSSHINWEISDNAPQNDDQPDPNLKLRSVSLNCSHWMKRNVLKKRLMNTDDKNRHFVPPITDTSKHGAKEMGHVKMAGPGLANDVTAWRPGSAPKKFTNKQEPKQQISTGHHCLYCDTTFPQFDDLIKHTTENHPYHCYYELQNNLRPIWRSNKNSTENHGSLMLKVKYLELNPSSGHYGYKSHNFNVIPEKIKALVPVCS